MSSPAAPEVVHDAAASRFVVHVDGVEAGYAEHVHEGDTVRFTHTVVDPAFEGRGLGSVLVAAALDAARAQGLGVLPQCSFVRAHLVRHPDLLELVPTDARAAYGL